MPSVTLSRRMKAVVWTIVALIVLIVIAVRSTGVYVDWLWFKQLHYRGVFSTVLWTRVVLFAIFGVLMALIIGGNLAIAYLLRPPFRPISAEQQNLERYRSVLEPRRKLILAIASVIALFTAGMSAQNGWAHWQLWLHGGKFGIPDPQFGKDISFYTWDYPVYRIMLSFGFTAVIFSIILSLVVHYISGAIRLQTPGPKVTPLARRHITILVFVFMALKACAYWLDRYGLVFSGRSGKFTGASYTDVHSVLPARTILFWVAVVLALAVLASLWLRSVLYPAIGFVVLLVLSIVISGIYPAIVQQVSVKPNANSKEASYILRNINSTRAAYDITTGTDVQYAPYTSTTTPPTAALSNSSPTIDNVRILDPNVISATFSKFQQDGNVYGFAPKLDVDRYTVNNSTHDYIVAVRELDATNLRGDQTNWINQHTVYTHGYGFIAAQANTDVTNGETAFEEGGIPQSGPLKVSQPRTYFGELLPDYSIVGAEGQPQEFDGNGDQKVRYDGGGGVSLGNIFTRLAFAVKYKQANFVLNDAASAKGATIIFNRDPRTMVQKVAPYLTVDSDPFPFVDQTTGHVMWMVDAYTTLNNYPYSQRESLSSLTEDSLSTTNRTAQQPNDSINYIRNSVKATIDAYTGKVTLYAWDETDPVLKAWMKIFPNTVQPSSAMPSDVREHVRYPEDLFEIQRATLGQYHVDNPQTFYNNSDRWTVPSDPTSNATANQPPFYVLAAQPDDSTTTAQFQLTSPMNVNGQAYLAAYVSVNSDPTDYGKMTVLQLPRGSSAVQAPEQVFSKISGNAVITKDLSLFNTIGGGSTVIHGNLLTLPIGNSFLYVEPLYTQSTTSDSGSYPQLQRIIAVYGNNVGYGATLTAALSDFQPGHVTGQTLNIPNTGNGQSTTPTPTPSSSTPTTPSSPTTPTSPTSPSTSAPSTGSAAALLAQIGEAYTGLQTCRGATDCATAQEKLNALVNDYLTKFPPKQ
jgi:hypothetical protein